MEFHEVDLVSLRSLIAEHDKLAQVYADADADEVDVDRIYAKLRDLEAEITAEVSELFDFYDNPKPKLRDLMNRPSPFKEDK